MARRCLWVFALAVCFSAAQAQTAPSTDADTIKELRQQLLKIQERLDALEAAQKTNASTPPATEPAAQLGATKPAAPAGMGDMGGMTEASLAGPRLKIRGYADLGYSATDQTGATNTFALGQFNLFITSQLSNRTSMLAEAVIESDTDNAFGIELERLLLRHSINDYLNFNVGRYHSAIGFYNTAYHHSAYMQTAIGRPLMFQFEDNGGILPVHNVGLSVDGRIPSGAVGLHYVFDVGNGRTALQDVGEPVQNRVDENNGKSVNLSLFAQPSDLRGFRAGASIYHDHLTPAGMANIGEFIYSGHAVYQNSRFEFLNEALVIRHEPDGFRVFHTPAAYTQVSESFGLVRPYFRFDYINPPAGDPILGSRGRRSGPSAGLRYDFDSSAAFKIQYSRITNHGTPVNGLAFQVSFAF